VSDAPTFSYSGHRYVLGHNEDVYAIWDRASPGEPRERFPRTDDGWAAAWTRFRDLEPQAVPVGGAVRGAAAAAFAGPAPAVEPVSGLATATTVLLALTGLANLAFGIVSFVRQPLVAVTRTDTFTETELIRQGGGIQAMSALASLLTLGTIITWLVWQHRAQRNLWAIGVPGLRFTPGWAVGWWFIPFANLVQPLRAMKELWLASGPDTTGLEWRGRPTPPLLPLWWSAYIVVPIVGGIFFFVRVFSFIERSVTRAELERFAREISRFQLIIGIANVIAAALAIMVVRNITARHTERLVRAQSEPVGTAPVAGDAPAFTHSGAQHVLGAYRGEYAIWRRDAPGEPAERFPATPEGWHQAWERFRHLEPHAAAVAPGGALAASAATSAQGTARAALICGIVALIPGLSLFLSPLTFIVGGIGWSQLKHSSNPARERSRLQIAFVLAGIGLAITIALMVSTSGA
jgi:hypothetical protein